MDFRKVFGLDETSKAPVLEAPKPPTPEVHEKIELPKDDLIEPPMAPVAEVPKPEMKVEMPEDDKIFKPGFVEQKDYKDVLDELSQVDAVIKQSQENLKELNEIKAESDTKLQEWRNNLEDIERKLLYIDKTLFEE